MTEQEVYDAFGRQAVALVTGGVDAIICETFESSVELRLALEAARDRSDVPLIASMAFRPEASGRYRSMMGEGPEDVVRVAAECKCAVVGTNCGQGIQTMAPLVGEVCSLAGETMPVIVQPNAGLPRLVNGRTVYEEDP
ncbi:MAG: homocysteine S-methyltransferase family protein, partial [Planctomycetota bacterium]